MNIVETINVCLMHAVFSSHSNKPLLIVHGEKGKDEAEMKKEAKHFSNISLVRVSPWLIYQELCKHFALLLLFVVKHTFFHAHFQLNSTHFTMRENFCESYSK